MSSSVVVSDQRSVMIAGINLTADAVSLLESMAHCSLATLASVRVELPDAMSAAASLPLMPVTDDIFSLSNETEAAEPLGTVPEEGKAGVDRASCLPRYVRMQIHQSIHYIFTLSCVVCAGERLEPVEDEADDTASLDDDSGDDAIAREAAEGVLREPVVKRLALWAFVRRLSQCDLIAEAPAAVSLYVLYCRGCVQTAHCIYILAKTVCCMLWQAAQAADHAVSGACTSVVAPPSAADPAVSICFVFSSAVISIAVHVNYYVYVYCTVQELLRAIMASGGPVCGIL